MITDIYLKKKNQYNQFFSPQKKKESNWSKKLLLGLSVIAFFANFIANDKPLYCQIESKHYFPVFREIAVDLNFSQWESPFINPDWRNLPYQKSLFPLIPYSENTADNANWSISPFAKQKVKSWHFRHWLGTHRVGRDVAAGLIYGTRKALLIGLLALSIAASIGVSLGVLAGYYGDNKMQISWWQLGFNLLFLPLAVFYSFIRNMDNPDDLPFGNLLVQGLSIFFLLFALLNILLSFFLKKRKSKGVVLPVDLLIMRLVEVINSIPTLLFLLALVAILQEINLWQVAVLIGLVSWTGLTRFARGEVLKIREMPYIEAAKALGFSPIRIMIRHLLPNALAPLLIVLAFGMGGTILLEASLSFLGIGSGIEEVTWGKLLAQAREKPAHWWLAVFPGMMIFLTVMGFNFFGRNMQEKA